jgi:hypothetical protein
VLASQKGLPFVELNGAEPEPAALQMLPEEKAKLQTALPLRLEDGQLVVAVADPSNDLMLENLRRSIGYEPRLVVAAQGELKLAIDQAYARLTAGPSAAETTVESSLIAPEPVAEVPPQPTVPSLQPETLPSLQPEPVQAVEPMPTVLPPAEDRSAEIAAPAPLATPPVEPAPVAEQMPPVQPPPPQV